MFIGARHPSEPIFLHVTSNVKKAWLDKEMMLMLNTLMIKKNVKKRKIKIVTIRWLKNYEELSCDSVILFLGIYPKWKQGLSPYVSPFVHQNHSSIILKIQKIDITEVFIDRGTDRENVPWAYNTTLTVLKEAWMKAKVLSAAMSRCWRKLGHRIQCE